MKKFPGNNLPLIWQRAAVLGSLWASIEIIAGSALHNLKIPMGGTALSAIGAALLIAAAQKWPQRGLFWRTGLICAALKSISPSAVIIAPMIAIAMEGFLLELGTLTLGRNRAGYMLAGALAISWSLIQKILTLLLAYGTDVAKLFESLVFFAQKNLPITSFEPYQLILLVYIIDLLIGCAVGYLAVSVGRSNPLPVNRTTEPSESPKQFASGREPKLYHLFLYIVLLIIGLTFLPKLHPLTSIAIVTAFAFVMTRIYHKSLARLKKPKLWLEISAVMLLAGLLLSDIWFGVRMISRAFFVLTTFSVISVELRNPIIIQWFANRGMHSLPQAVELAFAALPEMTQAVTSRWKSWRQFPALLPTLTSEADSWLTNRSRPVFVISGPIGSGKTTRLIELVKLLKESGTKVSGIIAHGLLEENVRTGFEIENITTSEKAPLCHRGKNNKFIFSDAGFEFGKKALSVDSELLVIDEIGPLELSGGGWAEQLHTSTQPLLIVVRSELLSEIKTMFANVIELPEASSEALQVIID